MQRTALLLTAVAALWAAPAHAQTDFLTLQENVDASGTALMCPTRADNYVDCADAGTLPVPLAARLAGADGKTIYICGRTASGGIVAAKAITLVTGTRDGIIYPNTDPPKPPNRLDRYPPSSIASPAEACAAAVSICCRNCAEHSDAATMTDCYLR
jgi:hypothetical protein